MPWRTRWFVALSLGFALVASNAEAGEDPDAPVIRPFRVKLGTERFVGLPDTDLDVRPLHVDLKAGKSIAQIDKASAKELKAGLEEASAGLGGG